jgi:hypothetical protein
MSRLNLCKLCGGLPRIDKFKPPASDWVYLVECSSKDCDNAEFGDTRKKPLASGTLLTPIGTGTCRSDNETVASFWPAKLSASCSNGSPRGRPSRRLLRMADIRRGRVGQPNLCILFVRSELAEIAQARVPSSFRHGFLSKIQTLFSRYSTPPNA